MYIDYEFISDFLDVGHKLVDVDEVQVRMAFKLARLKSLDCRP